MSRAMSYQSSQLNLLVLSPRRAAPTDAQASLTFSTWIDVYPSSPKRPSSTPIPEPLTPPNGISGPIAGCADAGGSGAGIGQFDLAGTLAVIVRQAVLALVLGTLDGVANQQRAAAVGCDAQLQAAIDAALERTVSRLDRFD